MRDTVEIRVSVTRHTSDTEYEERYVETHVSEGIAVSILSMLLEQEIGE